jgi:hypothetical protein
MFDEVADVGADDVVAAELMDGELALVGSDDVESSPPPLVHAASTMTVPAVIAALNN